MIRVETLCLLLTSLSKDFTRQHKVKISLVRIVRGVFALAPGSLCFIHGEIVSEGVSYVAHVCHLICVNTVPDTNVFRGVIHSCFTSFLCSYIRSVSCVSYLYTWGCLVLVP